MYMCITKGYRQNYLFWVPDKDCWKNQKKYAHVQSTTRMYPPYT